MKILSVKKDNQTVPFNETRESTKLILQIGDKDIYLENGLHSYNIYYQVENQIGYFDDYDELYWNITGNDWDFKINKATAKIMIPKGATIIENDCYTGEIGSIENYCEYQLLNDSTIYFETQKNLDRQEGLTISTAFSKGFIRNLYAIKKAEQAIQNERKLLLMVFIGFIYMLIAIILRQNFYFDEPLRTPPSNWSAPEIGYLMNKKYNAKCIFSLLISLVNKGHLQIDKNKSLYIFQKKESPELLDEDEKLVCQTLFKTDSKLELTDNGTLVFYEANIKLIKSLEQKIKKQQYYKESSLIKYILPSIFPCIILIYILTRHVNIESSSLIALILFWLNALLISLAFKLKNIFSLFVLIFLIIFFTALPFFYAFFISWIEDGINYEAGTLILLSGVFWFLIKYRSKLIPRPSEKELFRKIAGLKKYLKEIYSENMGSNTEKTNLLPYAIALDIDTKQWENLKEQLSNYSTNYSTHTNTQHSSGIKSESNSYNRIYYPIYYPDSIYFGRTIDRIVNEERIRTNYYMRMYEMNRREESYKSKNYSSSQESSNSEELSSYRASELLNIRNSSESNSSKSSEPSNSNWGSGSKGSGSSGSGGGGGGGKGW